MPCRRRRWLLEGLVSASALTSCRDVKGRRFSTGGGHGKPLVGQRGRDGGGLSGDEMGAKAGREAHGRAHGQRCDQSRSAGKPPSFGFRAKAPSALLRGLRIAEIFAAPRPPSI